MKKIYSIILIGMLFVIGLSMYVFFSRNQPEENIHYHAGFLVYVNGVRQDYSDSVYMNVEPCNAPGVKHTENDQLEKAHLHDNVGDVVHMHRNGAEWQDLFTNIRVTFPKDLPIAGYINGKNIPDILHTPITAYDSAIFVIGDSKGVDLSGYVTKSHIQEVEKKSETCGS
jgi:hypothetical protein